MAFVIEIIASACFVSGSALINVHGCGHLAHCCLFGVEWVVETDYGNFRVKRGY